MSCGLQMSYSFWMCCGLLVSCGWLVRNVEFKNCSANTLKLIIKKYCQDQNQWKKNHYFFHCAKILKFFYLSNFSNSFDTSSLLTTPFEHDDRLYNCWIDCRIELIPAFDSMEMYSRVVVVDAVDAVVFNFAVCLFFLVGCCRCCWNDQQKLKKNPKISMRTTIKNWNFNFNKLKKLISKKLTNNSRITLIF